MTGAAAMSTTFLPPLLLAGALWGWPSPTPRDRVPELGSGGDAGEGGVGKLPGWMWFAAAAPLLLGGPHVALAMVMVARTVMSLAAQSARRGANSPLANEISTGCPLSQKTHALLFFEILLM